MAYIYLGVKWLHSNNLHALSCMYTQVEGDQSITSQLWCSYHDSALQLKVCEKWVRVVSQTKLTSDYRPDTRHYEQTVCLLFICLFIW